MHDLEAVGISQLYPGFDVLTIVDGKPDRLIELKSSGVDARVQAMSWNEWKTARASILRGSFWLYLVGNLRSDLPHADPYVRVIHDPFGSLVADEISEMQLRRAVQLRVREFKQAEHLDLGVANRELIESLVRGPSTGGCGGRGACFCDRGDRGACDVAGRARGSVVVDAADGRDVRRLPARGAGRPVGRARGSLSRGLVAGARQRLLQRPRWVCSALRRYIAPRANGTLMAGATAALAALPDVVALV